MITFALAPSPGLFPYIFIPSAISLGVGVFIFFFGNRNQASIVFSVFCFFTSIWGFSHSFGSLAINPMITVLCAYGTVYGALPIPYLFFLLCSSFPNNKLPFNKNIAAILFVPSIIMFLYILFGKMMSATVAANNMLHIDLYPAHNYYLFNIVVFLAAGMLVLFSRYTKATSYEKSKYQYLFLGIILAALTGYGLSAFSVPFGRYDLVYLGPVGLSFLSILAAYAIFKYRVMDISLVLKKTTAYSLVTTAITFFFVIVVLAFEFLSRFWLGYSSFWAAIPSALVITVTFVPLRDRLQKLTDQIFFRRTLEYQRTVKEITKLVSTVIDLETMFRLIDRTIVRVMCLKSASVLLLEEKEDHYVVEKVNGLPQATLGIKVQRNNPMIEYLGLQADAVVKDEIKSLMGSDSATPEQKVRLGQVFSEMTKFDAAVSIPSFSRGRLVGVLNLGEKLSGEPYSPEDLEMLLTLASEAGIAIENSKLYRDVTETKDYLNRLIEHSDDAIITVDLEGKVMSWNRGAVKIFGYEASEILGRDLPVFDNNETMNMVNRAVAREEIKTAEVVKKAKSGMEVPLAVTASPIVGAKGNVMGLSLILKDISEIKRMEIMKSEFLAGISNELRTPITPIIEYVDILKEKLKGPLNTEQEQMLESIDRQVVQLNRLIDSLMELTEVESGTPIDVKKDLVSINKIVDDVLGSFGPQFKEREFSVEKRMPEVVTVMADRNKLIRLFSNLIGNSIKFTPNRGRITVKCDYLDNRYIEVAVEDSGIGVERQYLERIFDKFFQVDISYARRKGGVGLGLAIAKKIVEAHGGNIHAESEGNGRGLKVVFRLPIESTANNKISA